MRKKCFFKLNLLENNLKKLGNLNTSFDYIKINIASPEKIQSWADRLYPNGEIYGEVARPDTLNFRTHKPEEFGLFCQKLFGPIKNWKCNCKKYSTFSFGNVNKVCDKCLIELTESRIRRYRMAYIGLVCPIVHHWYMKGIPNYLLTILKIYGKSLKASDIEKIIYFKKEKSPKINGKKNPLRQFFTQKTELEVFFLKNFLQKRSVTFKKNQDININTLSHFKSRRVGAEIIKAALESISLKREIQEARSLITFTNFNKLDDGLIRRTRILENFFATQTNLSWMILTSLPVLPPGLRPIIELEKGKLISADINELYKLIITRNQRLFDFLYKYGIPQFINICTRKLLQEGVDALIDNAKLPKYKKRLINNRPLKGLTEILEGKYGRFRYSLLGKRVDYSARSIIIVNPQLRLNQCGIPYDIAIQLFQPFLINILIKIKTLYFDKKRVTHILQKNKLFIWGLLEILIKKYIVLLNRAPTLHRYGIQAFEPILVLGQAIHLHPLVCAGFNADFDGDQMAVHLPLSCVSQLETQMLIKPSFNILSSANGEVQLKPTQDMVIGCYYLTILLNKINYNKTKWFENEEIALLTYYQKKLNLHTSILIKYSLNNLLLKQEGDTFVIQHKKSYDDITSYKIQIYKKLKNGNNLFLISNIGIFLARYNKEYKCLLTHCFVETTPGRLIFNKNLQEVYNKLSKNSYINYKKDYVNK